MSSFTSEDDETITPGEQQTLIRQVQGDSSMTATEKNAAVRQILQKKIHTKQVEKSLCTHYDKKCNNFYFECCGIYDSCHRCHAEYSNCEKREIKTIKCTECNTEQGLSNKCISCSITFGHSFCLQCKIWTSVDIFHCDGCGICRVGLAKDYTHCDKCNACFSATSAHKCQFFKPLDQLQCLVCMECAHSSQDSIYPLPCGHVMHSKCLDSYIQSNQYKCPTCRKSVCDMTQSWANIKEAIVAQPMPDEYKRDVDVLCYDCGEECRTALHFMGMECEHCGSYNTSQK